MDKTKGRLSLKLLALSGKERLLKKMNMLRGAVKRVEF